jgi:hypothetical protein
LPASALALGFAADAAAGGAGSFGDELGEYIKLIASKSSSSISPVALLGMLLGDSILVASTSIVAVLDFAFGMLDGDDISDWSRLSSKSLIRQQPSCTQNKTFSDCVIQ